MFLRQALVKLAIKFKVACKDTQLSLELIIANNTLSCQRTISNCASFVIFSLETKQFSCVTHELWKLAEVFLSPRVKCVSQMSSWVKDH